MSLQIFDYFYEAMYSSAGLAIFASFAWGVFSILLSPCHLSSIPLVVGFVGSQSEVSSKKAFHISLVFSVGILITIALIGLITASLGRMMGDIGNIGNYLVALIFFIVGLYLLDVVRLDWNTFGIKPIKLQGLPAAFVLGLLFGLALGPCTFAYMAPVLGIVFQTAQTNYFLAIVFLAAFGVGHCSVIVGAGTLTGRIQKYLNWTEESKAVLWLKRICGILVIAGGIYLIIK